MGRKWTLAFVGKSFLQRPLYVLSCAMLPLRLRFTPVALKARHDGWTAVRQRRFIEVLAETRSVTRACAAVGKSAATAYALRNRSGAESFAAAWDRALTSPSPVRQPAPRAARRLGRVRAKAEKAEEVHEIDGPPVSPGQSMATWSALQALETCLAQLRTNDGASSRAAQRSADPDWIASRRSQ
jgi:hypothetical protein